MQFANAKEARVFADTLQEQISNSVETAQNMDQIIAMKAALYDCREYLNNRTLEELYK